MIKPHYSILTLALIGLGFSAHAVTPPTGGQVLQESLTQPQQPLAPSVDMDLQGPPLLDEMDEGQAVALTAVEISGNIVFTSQQLLALIGDVTQAPKTLGDMRKLANQISEFYRQNGYPFARAYLPAQRLSQGVLKVSVLEGRYGRVQALGAFAEQVQPYLSQIEPGALIESAPLERTVMVVGDIPGIYVTPILKPGQNTGEADLDVEVEEAPRFSARVSVDNHGNRYTGANRLNVGASANRLAVLGDTLNANVLLTDEQMWFGNLGYSLPLGWSGARGNLSVVRTDYEIKDQKDFPGYQAAGVADIVSAGVSYPLVRTEQRNLSFSVQFEHKAFSNETNGQKNDSKKVLALPIALSFDQRDGVLGGGVSYGSLSLSLGRLDLQGEDLQNDLTTAKTEGGFYKLNLDVSRIQRLAKDVSGFARLAGQWANKNLDGAEDMSLGGPNGVRAYPQGEAGGDQAWLTQLELRYNWRMLSPFAFYDYGTVKVNTDAWDSADNRRDISGYGVGLRVNHQQWSAELSAAWRDRGGEPTADTKDHAPRIWGTLGYQF